MLVFCFSFFDLELDNIIMCVNVQESNERALGMELKESFLANSNVILSTATTPTTTMTTTTTRTTTIIMATIIIVWVWFNAACQQQFMLS